VLGAGGAGRWPLFVPFSWVGWVAEREIMPGVYLRARGPSSRKKPPWVFARRVLLWNAARVCA